MMHTFFQVLFGEIIVKSYTLEEQSCTRSDGKRSYKKTMDSTYDSSDQPISLTPNSNNIHEVVAKTDVAFFDCLIPPYKDNCNFYRMTKGHDSENEIVELICVGSEPESSYYTVARTYSGAPFTLKPCLQVELVNAYK